MIVNSLTCEVYQDKANDHHIELLCFSQSHDILAGWRGKVEEVERLSVVNDMLILHIEDTDVDFNGLFEPLLHLQVLLIDFDELYLQLLDLALVL